MRPSNKALSLSFKKDRPSEPERAQQRAVRDTDELAELTMLAESLGWNFNAVLTGISFRFEGDIWKAVLKVEMPSGPKYATFTGTSLFQLVDTVHWYSSKGRVEWQRDKHPVKVTKRSGVYVRKPRL